MPLPRRPSPEPWARRSTIVGRAALALVAALLLAGCHHDWDELRYDENAESLCSRLCEGHDHCVQGAPLACEALCSIELSDCSGRERDDVAACVDRIEVGACEIGTQAEWKACIEPIACFDFP